MTNIGGARRARNVPKHVRERERAVRGLIARPGTPSQGEDRGFESRTRYHDFRLRRWRGRSASWGGFSRRYGAASVSGVAGDAKASQRQASLQYVCTKKVVPVTRLASKCSFAVTLMSPVAGSRVPLLAQ